MYSIIVTILLVIFVLLYFATRSNCRSLSIDGTKKLAAADVRYALLQKKHNDSEEGITQICENYENDALDIKQKIGSLELNILIFGEEVSERDKIIENHAKHCHGIVEDTIEMLMERIAPMCDEKEHSEVPSDG